MAYADYDFYTQKYHGKLLSFEEFLEYEDKASDWIDIPTFSRLHDGMPEDMFSLSKIRKCVCAIAESLYKFQRADDLAGMSMSSDTVGNIAKIEGKAVKSISSGSESVTYITPLELINGAKGCSAAYSVAGDERSRDRYLVDIANKYLIGITDSNGIPLLYAGI